jgi:hypothetical protein
MSYIYFRRCDFQGKKFYMKGYFVSRSLYYCSKYQNKILGCYTRPTIKHVEIKSFQVGDMLWKTILPLKTKDHKFYKWSLSWKGPYKFS